MSATQGTATPFIRPTVCKTTLKQLRKSLRPAWKGNRVSDDVLVYLNSVVDREMRRVVINQKSRGRTITMANL